MQMIHRERFLQLMTAQAAFGATAAGGVSRPALSPDDHAVRGWFRQQIEREGLEYRIDAVGNQTARLACGFADAKTLLIGSHFDSVPNGGRFDGALGMLAAFEAALSIRDAGIQLPFDLEVINFTDEEGTHLGLCGSTTLTGGMTTERLAIPRDGRAALEAGFAQLGLDLNRVLEAQRDPATLAGYIEVHIEQGTRLEKANLDIGVVTSIVGIRSFWLTLLGEAAHAGTMPMDQRKDAFFGVLEYAQRARELIMRDFHPGTLNFGRVELAPGAFNIVPARATIGVEFRHGDPALFDAMESALRALAQEVATGRGLGIEIQKVDNVLPALMHEQMIEHVEAAADTLGLRYTRLMSFAGHDAQSMARVCPAVMYFVPSVDGISHNPREFTSDDDCVNAANVMLQAVLQFAQNYQ
jgi:hydantoinase/carbamoylase family amidase